MNTEALFLFLILLLGLVLCSFLGGNCGNEGFTNNPNNDSIDKANEIQSSSGASTTSANKYDNYNHYSGISTQLTPGTIFYGPNNTTTNVITNSDGTQSLQIILPGSSTPITLSSKPSNVESYTNYYGNQATTTTFYGPNGVVATVINTNNGQQAIKVTTPKKTYYYYISGTYSNTTNTSTQYYGSTGYPIQQAPNSLAYTGPYGNAQAISGPYGGSAGAIAGPSGNTAYYAQGPMGNTVVGKTSGADYSTSLPQGIPRSQIPPGKEDLYILKSEVVPPVCPACPASSACPRQEPCPPCPACARCPEPAFECKKVPNYNAINNDYLPTPVLNDFSQFGM